MFVQYDGPPDQVNRDVAAALAESRGSSDLELTDPRDSTPEDATLHVTDTEEASAVLEPGKVYDLPQELAQQLVDTTTWWSVAATDFSKLSKTKLSALAKERGIAGYTTMSQDELVAALRGASS